MPRSRSTDQKAEVTAFVNWLYEQSGCETWEEFAKASGVHFVSLSRYHLGDIIPDGYNLFRLIRAAGVLPDPDAQLDPQAELEASIAQLRRVLKQLEAPRSGEARGPSRRNEAHQ